MEKIIESKRDSDGLNYFEIGFQLNGKEYNVHALFKTGSEATIVSSDLVGLNVDELKETKVDVGFETIKVYELPVDWFFIGGEVIKGVDKIFISDLDYFKDKSILGCDILNGLSFSSHMHGGIEIKI